MPKNKTKKDKKKELFFGLKVLKNSPTLSFFHKVWEIVKQYWEKNQIGKEFINTFESEYIKKQVEWHFGAAFPGKSRTNNSLKSGNNVLKIFFQRKPQNIKVFFAKMKDFVREWSLQEKTTFPNQVEFLTLIKNDALECAKEENFMFHPQTPNLLYYPRKGIPKETLNVALESRIKRNNIPNSFEELYQGWCYFRVLHLALKTWACGQFFKYSYCKHTIALDILEGCLSDPEIKEKKKRGRKANITKALQK